MFTGGRTASLAVTSADSQSGGLIRVGIGTWSAPVTVAVGTALSPGGLGERGWGRAAAHLEVQGRELDRPAGGVVGAKGRPAPDGEALELLRAAAGPLAPHGEPLAGAEGVVPREGAGEGSGGVCAAGGGRGGEEEALAPPEVVVDVEADGARRAGEQGLAEVVQHHALRDAVEERLLDEGEVLGHDKHGGERGALRRGWQEVQRVFEDDRVASDVQEGRGLIQLREIFQVEPTSDRQVARNVGQEICVCLQWREEAMKFLVGPIQKDYRRIVEYV